MKYEDYARMTYGHVERTASDRQGKILRKTDQPYLYEWAKYYPKDNSYEHLGMIHLRGANGFNAAWERFANSRWAMNRHFIAVKSLEAALALPMPANYQLEVTCLSGVYVVGIAKSDDLEFNQFTHRIATRPAFHMVCCWLAFKDWMAENVNQV
jgi:hypothetical protein